MGIVKRWNAVNSPAIVINVFSGPCAATQSLIKLHIREQKEGGTIRIRKQRHFEEFQLLQKLQELWNDDNQGDMHTQNYFQQKIQN